MLHKKYSIFTTEEILFDLMCLSLLSQIRKETNVVKIAFFRLPESNQDYLDELGSLISCVAKFFPGNPPLISYIAQEPFNTNLIAEVVSILPAQNFKTHYGENYIVLENGFYRELISGGILPPDISATHFLQSNAVFSQIDEMLALEKFPLNSLVRQWNYIENIALYKGGYQNYQEFCDSRSNYYAKGDWSLGYPAATGIGTSFGGIMAEFIAFSGSEVVNLAIDNPLQVAAYKYSPNVLRGPLDPFCIQPATPKFERARLVASENSKIIFISGTAAIRGESSVFEDDLEDQAYIIMQNIENLLSYCGYPVGIPSVEFQMIRIYVKNKSQMKEVRNYMNVNYSGLKYLLLCADICREELLLEIEGIALEIL